MSEISVLNGYKIKDKKAKRFYDNVESMKADTTLKVGMYIETKGYYTANDGGSAHYHIVSETNKYSENLTNGLKAELLINDKINILQVGIKENITDDISDKLQKVLSIYKNIKIELNSGTYNIEKQIELENNILKGNDSIINCMETFTNETMLSLNQNINIDNIKFNGNYKVYSIIGKENTNNEIISNCEFYGCITNLQNIFPLDSCIYLTGKNVTFINSKVHDNKGHGARCYASQENSKLIVDKCDFYENGYTEKYQACGLCEYDESIGLKYDVAKFTNCNAYHNGASGIACHSISNIEVDNCYSHNNGEHGVVLMDGKNGKITNCSLIDNEYYGVRVQGNYNSNVGHYDNFIVTNNTITGKGGIWISFNIKNGIIKNNVINLNGSPKYGILLGDVNYPKAYIKNIIISNNIINNFPFKTALNTEILFGVDVKIENNLIDGQYRNGATFNTSYKGYIVGSNNKYGETNNIALNPTDFNQSSWIKPGSITDNAITPSNGIITYQDITLKEINPKYVSLLMNFENYEYILGLNLRFRDSNGQLVTFKLPETTVSINETGWNNIPQSNTIGIVYDLTKYIFDNDIKTIEIFIKTASNNTEPIKINSVYCALSNELPIMPIA